MTVRVLKQAELFPIALGNKPPKPSWVDWVIDAIGDGVRDAKALVWRMRFTAKQNGFTAQDIPCADDLRLYDMTCVRLDDKGEGKPKLRLAHGKAKERDHEQP